jgi:hypothetical protein
MGGAQAGVWSKSCPFRPRASALGSNTLCALRCGGCERLQSWGQVGRAMWWVVHMLELGQSCSAQRAGRCVGEGQSMRNVVVVASV